MRHHPLIGANILKPVAFPWAITPIVRHHHEHFDGTGYPAGLKGEEIPLLARILTAADSYEAMTADRPYRRGLAIGAALEELRSCSGTQFDPRIVETLVSIVEEEELATEDAGVRSVADEVAHEEVRAIFAALVDGVFSSFRRLGGPRLASNVEADVDQQFETSGWPFRVDARPHQLHRASWPETTRRRARADAGGDAAHRRDPRQGVGRHARRPLLHRRLRGLLGEA